MRRVVFLGIYFVLCWLGKAEAQVLEGRITDQEGKGVEGATVYVKEAAQGCAADERGAFRIPLPTGNYSCEISCLGFEKQFLQVEVKEGMEPLLIRLEPAVYQLREVNVSSGGEDPARYIMRHAIAKAPYHRNQVRRYVSEVYTKGTARLDKVPRLLMLGADARKEIGPMIGKLFLLESVMEIEFTAPHKYERKILAFSSTIPDNMDPGDALNIITASIYDPSVMNVVSPLAPGAFSYYRFKFAECYSEGKMTVNKIRVEPRKKNSQLLDGWIYIVEDDWSVVNFDFVIKVMGITARLKGVFHEVKPTVFLPTSYDIDVNVKTFGVRAGGKYYSSVKYKEVEAISEDRELAGGDFPEIQKEKGEIRKPSAKREKAEKQLEALASKEKLTTREAYRMARLTQQLLEPQRSDTLPSLEIREIQQQDKVTVDSMATRRDSSYWVKMRTLPLRKEEIVSYQIKDSLTEVVQRNYRETDSLRRFRKKIGLGEIVEGGERRLGKQVFLSYDGLLKAVPEYNFVDGFRIGQGFDLHFRLKRGKDLHLRPSLYYLTARKTVWWEIKGQYDYAPMRSGRLTLGFGEVSADYKGERGSLRLENSLTSLVCADNFIKFYGKRYIGLQNEIDLLNGFNMLLGGNYEKRQVLGNHISYNFYKKDPESNSPVTEGGRAMPDNTALSFFVQAQYIPRCYYRVENGRKKYVRSAWPSFAARYERGIPVGPSEYRSAYDRLEVGVAQRIKLGIFNRIQYRVAAGKFFSRKELYFPDFKHFTTTGWILNRDEFAGGFFLTDYYELSTNDRWLEGALNYTSSYLLVKRLPFMQRFFFNEALHLRYIWTPAMRNYEECGYSIGLETLGRVGVFFGFDRKGYRGTGFRISVQF